MKSESLDAILRINDQHFIPKSLHNCQLFWSEIWGNCRSIMVCSKALSHQGTFGANAKYLRGAYTGKYGSPACHRGFLDRQVLFGDAKQVSGCELVHF